MPISAVRIRLNMFHPEARALPFCPGQTTNQFLTLLFDKNATLHVGLQTEFFTPPLADGVDMVHDFDQSKNPPFAVDAYLKRRLTA